MRFRAIASILALSIATASVPTAAIAQGMDADTREAKSLFEEGLKLYKTGKPEEARVKFKAAYGLKKRPSIVLNLAHTELDTKRPLEAAAHFREALALPGLDKDDQDNARGGLADARKQLGVVNVDAPAGSSVTIDGEVRQGPYADGIDVLPGAHTVQIKNADGKESVDRIQLVAGGSTTVRFRATATAPKTVEPPKTVETPKTTEAPQTTEATTEPPQTTEATPEGEAPKTTEQPKEEAPMRTSFLASIHPVTYVAAGVTVVSALLWPIFWTSRNIHSDNVGILSAWVLDPKNANNPNMASVKAQGLYEVDQTNKYNTLTNVFGVVTLVGAVVTVGSFFLLRKKDQPESAPTAALSVAPTWGGATFSLTGTF